jgi:twitching motility protein PilJ
MFGGDKAKTLDGEDLDMPTTQVKMAQTVQAGYDPLASVSIMEQLRSASANMATPRKLPLIGNLPVVKQFQTLGVLMVTFLLFAALLVLPRLAAIVAGRGRIGDRDGNADALAASCARQHERGTGPGERVPDCEGKPRPLQGRSRRAPAGRQFARRRRDRHGAGRDDRQAPERRQDALGARGRRRGRLIENETSLTSLAKGLDALNSGNNALLDLAQQASAQIAQGGGSLREIEYANQLAVLSQRIAKNANSLASSEEIEPTSRSSRQGHRDVQGHPQRSRQGQRLAASAGGAQRRGARHAERAPQALRAVRGGHRAPSSPTCRSS